MASRICWSCGVNSHQTLLESSLSLWSATGSYMAAYQCDECKVLTLAALNPKLSEQLGGRNLTTSMNNQSAQLTWFPVTALGKVFPDVPQHIAAAASEAHSCQSINAFRAAVLLARSVIEATAKERGITNGSLVSKIDEMHNQHLIRELVREQAHEIRHLGNDMAHGDFVTPVTEEEAAEILELMGELLNEVYQAPAKLNARRLARLAKQQANSGNS